VAKNSKNPIVIGHLIKSSIENKNIIDI